MERKALVLSTMAAALILFSMAAIGQISQASTPVVVKVGGSPTIGRASAPIEIVLIEDFQCKNCRAFSKKIIPQIQSEYILSGRVRFVLVPVSFLKGSQAIANAALEVYVQQPEQFFTYLKEILNHKGEIKKGDLVKLAKKVGGVDLDKLKNCIEMECHNKELQNNLDWAQGVMGSHFRTPALYINGAPGSTYSFEAIRYQIDQILGKK